MVTKRVCILTYGCQMNVYDSARMAEMLAPLGYQRTAAPDDAELVILNTCHIRERAAEKVYSELGKLRPLQARKTRRGGTMLIAVGGCVAQARVPRSAAAPRSSISFSARRPITGCRSSSPARCATAAGSSTPAFRPSRGSTHYP